jgi:hypothetical protein
MVGEKKVCSINNEMKLTASPEATASVLKKKV